jgi:Kdo2-lipid IVA lauroyltransferase/acyltransferase
MAYISYLLTRFFVGLFWFIPYKLLYVISDGLSWFFFKIGYRQKVVYGNLKRCFPEKSETEISVIAREAYRNLADITLESIKGITTPIAAIHRRYRTLNHEILNQQLDAGRSVIFTGGHYCNWEWGVLTVSDGFHGEAIGVYKPLSNKHINAWLFQHRSRSPRMILTGMRDTYKAVETRMGLPTVFMLVSDQSPSNRKTAIWTNFFGQETACLPGAETIARQHNYPVFFYDIQRIGRGFYELTLKEICLEPKDMAEGSVMQAVMDHLEQQIRKKPENWLWSHRRWKMAREA